MKKGQTILFLGLYFTFVLAGLFAVLFGTQVSVNANPANQSYILDLQDNQVPLARSFDTPVLAGDLVVHFLNVGQADSIFIQLPNGETMLIDGGNSRSSGSIMRYKRTLDVSVIDYLVITHPHADHIGGLPAIINAFEIKSIFMPRVSHTTQAFERLLASIDKSGVQIDEAKAGVEILSIPDLFIEIIAPVRTDYLEHNDHSAVVKITYGSTSFLFMGDAESTSEGHITADVYADVLKVGHHGSSTSTSAYFLRKVAPSHAVISVGRNNSYGHPSDSVLARLDNAGVDVFRTDLNGTIVFASDGENISVNKTPITHQPQVHAYGSPGRSNVGSGPERGTESGSSGRSADSSGGNGSVSQEPNDHTVYTTNTGNRYHSDGCRHLSRSQIETTLSAATARGLTACGSCSPPR